MKTIITRIALLALPFIIYTALFFYFEPYDYLGLKGGAVNEDSVITRVRSFLSDPKDNVIFGDSRMAHFDMDLVESTSGEEFSNLAFGGASLIESIDLFYLAKEANPDMKRCYFTVSFYNLREGDERNRTSAIKTVAENPLAYFFNFNYQVDMLSEASLRLQGVQTGASRDTGVWTDEDFFDENGNPYPYRKNLMEYAQDVIYDKCVDYNLSEDNMRKLGKLASDCEKDGIELIFVFPPSDASIIDLVVEPLGIMPILGEVKSELAATGATIRDFEYEPEVVFMQDQFYDGFHLDLKTGLPEFTTILFGEEGN